MQVAFAFTAGFLPLLFSGSDFRKARISLSELLVLSPQLEEENGCWIEPDVHVDGSPVGSVRLLSQIHCK